MKPEDYMRQAGMTASTYMNAAVEAIDTKFGDGFAKENPQLVGSFMLSASLDFLACSSAKAVGDSIAYLSTNIVDAIEMK